MNYKTLNTIRKIIFSPFIFPFRILNFMFFPSHLVFGFLCTDFENEWEREFYFHILKRSISFGFWREK